MTKLQKWSTQYVAILLALAILMLLVPKVSAAEYMKRSCPRKRNPSRLPWWIS